MGKVILLMLSLCVASSIANRCANLGLYTLPDENSCTKYYICLHGQELANECAEGLFFDPTTGNCNLESNTMCLLASCPADNVGSLSLVPSYENCSNYYACIRGVASRMVCSEGLLYNPVKKACDFAERVTCALPIVKHSYTIIDCPLTGVTKVPHNDDCSKFYVCINGRSSEYTCAGGSLYNPKNQRCDRPEKTKCFNA
ncbi:putative chitinase 10 [Pseudolycoriella hygida]|uniref:Chitinase 10 n=1 Tax=Pseudolycoriella hygida TaxID=35572 RepID=A0A9Q0MX45_9DIPT|nr:putative chitinase 10 [Pseudolycoriella hygida]